jgi:hypothetical protein
MTAATIQAFLIALPLASAGVIVLVLAGGWCLESKTRLHDMIGYAGIAAGLGVMMLAVGIVARSVGLV